MTDLLRDDFKAEYLVLQQQYQDYDGKVLTIKGLATPLFGGGLAFGLHYHSFATVGVTGLRALALWPLEAAWKSFQYANRFRLEALEAWFRGDGDPALKPFQIYRSFWEGLARWRTTRAFLYSAFQPFVMLPYGVIAVGVVVAGGVLLAFPEAVAT